MGFTANRPGIILASKSPRRRYLLEKAGLEFTVAPSEVDENSIAISTPEAYVKKLAEAKAMDISVRYPDCWVIGADTIVFIDNTIMGKPVSRDDARAMISNLSAKTHQVHTGYCICHKATKHFISECITTDVSFKKLSPKEIDWYINSGEPFDKAGSYGIQGGAGGFVDRLQGSYTNVVGLPVAEVIQGVEALT